MEFVRPMRIMAKSNILYTGSGIELVRRLAGEGVRIFTPDQAREIASDIGLSEGYLRQALHHLTRSGWLVRLRKGLYAISSTVPGVAPVHEFEIAMALVDPAAISHWSAIHYHGLTEQAPRRIFILTTTDVNIPRKRGSKTGRKENNDYILEGTPYQFVQVKPQGFFGVQSVWVGEVRVSITNIERTLLACLTHPKYCGDFFELLHAFGVARNGLKLERIIDYALRLDAAVAKRLGWILEEYLEVDAAKLEPLRAVSVRGYRKLDPTGPGKGRCNRRWMIQENLPGKVLR